MMNTTANKELVTRYNVEVIGGGDVDALKKLTSPNFINHTAPEGMDAGQQGLIYFVDQILNKAFPGRQLSILEMIAEGDKVATRKSIKAIHTGELMGIPATGKEVTITITDILKIENGVVAEHWNESNFPQVLQVLKG